MPRCVIIRRPGRQWSQASSALEKAVWTLDANNKPQRVVVTTGETDGNYTEVTGGALKDGGRVIVAALQPAAVPSTTTASGKGPGF